MKTSHLSFTFGLFAILLIHSAEASAQDVCIKKAVPVWVAEREKEMNLNLGFRGVFDATVGDDVTLKVAASSIYRAFVNGKFVGSGPARAAHGYYRVDEYPIGHLVCDDDNIVAIEVAGYNVNTFYTLDQPSFLLAEVESGDKPLLSTGKNRDFEAFTLKERLQKVERYSFQRPFSEYYRMSEGYDRWRTDASVSVSKLKLATFPPVRLLPRHVPLPTFDLLYPVSIFSKGTFKQITPTIYYKDRSLKDISPIFKGYRESELEVRAMSQEIQEIATASCEIVNRPILMDTPSIGKNEFRIYDFGVNYTGFIGAQLECLTPLKIIFHFDEMLINDDVLPTQRHPGVSNQVVYELHPGVYQIESIEAYTLRYLKIMVLQGDCRINQVWLREFACPDNKNATFTSSNFKLNSIFAAAKQTLRQNAVDVLTDCPSRERAGWLCDSYFSAIMEKEFTGSSAVADNFYENFALPQKFDFIPEGMIPMCYPADHPEQVFIPQWSLWFILQVDDYAQRNGNKDIIARLKPRIEKLLAWFARYENRDGLLEKLPSWNFIEWSRANDFVQDVSYPTNMLYSAALNSAARLYGNNLWTEKAARVKQSVLQQSYNGVFFIDNAIRQDGKLTPTANTSEACQYYAFFFNIATPASHPELWKRLVSEFGPNRDDKITWPDVFISNAFIGNYLRVELLSRYGLQTQLLLEIQDYFYAMAHKTGTLWENMQNTASANHGFASYIGHLLYRDILGISHINYICKEVTIRFIDLPLDHCRGSIPVGQEVITLEWERKGNEIRYTAKVPPDYSVKIENRGHYKIIENN